MHFKFGSIVVTLADVYVRVVKEDKDKTIMLSWEEWSTFLEYIAKMELGPSERRLLSANTCVESTKYQNQYYTGLFRVFGGTANPNYKLGFNIQSELLLQHKEELDNFTKEAKTVFKIM